MAAVDIQFPGNIAQVRSAAELRALPSYAIESGTLYVVTSLGRAFGYDSGSVAIDDGSNVIKPNDRTTLQAGRWLYQMNGFAPGPPGASDNTYSDLAAFKASDVTRAVASLADVPGVENGRVFWTPGDFSATPTAELDRRVFKADGIPLSQGAWVRADGPLYAGNFGVRGDKVTDDTAATQAFLNICTLLGREANFGGLQVRITGPLSANNVSVVFENPGLGNGEPGFYPVLPASGPNASGYTAITFAGQCSRIRLTGIGSGAVGVASAGGGPATVTSDTRQPIVGVQLGTTDVPLIHVSDCMIKAINFGRQGVRATFVNDSNMALVSTELCGGIGNVGGSQVDYPAIDFPDGGFGTTGSQAIINLTNWGVIQAEQSVGRAFRMEVGTLANVVQILHCERILSVPGDTAPMRAVYLSGRNQIGGEIRIQTYSNAGLGVTCYGQNTIVSNATLEGGIVGIVAIADIGQYLKLNEIIGNIRSGDASAGAIYVEGGTGAILPGSASNSYPAVWMVRARSITELQLGGTSGDQNFQVIDCPILSITRSPAAAISFARLVNVDAVLTVTPHPNSVISQIGGSVYPLNGMIELANCLWLMSAGASWNGSLQINGAGILLAEGCRITGDFTRNNGPAQSLLQGTIGGTVVNAGNPAITGTRLGTIPNGTRNKNFTNPGPGQPFEYGVVAGAWVPLNVQAA
jgi:hypothetical protein